MPIYEVMRYLLFGQTLSGKRILLFVSTNQAEVEDLKMAKEAKIHSLVDMDVDDWERFWIEERDWWSP